MGRVVSSKVLNLLSRTFRLSSLRTDSGFSWARAYTLWIIHCFETSMKITQGVWVLSPITSAHPSRLFWFRGNPSIRYFLEDQPWAFMAYPINSTVSWTGTILPSWIMDSINSPFSLPVSTSYLSNSPADRCTKFPPELELEPPTKL